MVTEKRKLVYVIQTEGDVESVAGNIKSSIRLLKQYVKLNKDRGEDVVLDEGKLVVHLSDDYSEWRAWASQRYLYNN